MKCNIGTHYIIFRRFRQSAVYGSFSRETLI
jgi:hypothetical protein